MGFETRGLYLAADIGTGFESSLWDLKPEKPRIWLVSSARFESSLWDLKLLLRSVLFCYDKV